MNGSIFAHEMNKQWRMKQMVVKIENVQKSNNKLNKQFAILSAIGIIMVVSAHCNSSLNLFSDYFPYNSFFMPMFVFISGYFFKDENTNKLGKYIFNKIKRLLIYYFIWNLIYGIIRIILYKIGFLGSTAQINIKSLFILPFINGQQFGLNAPSWFIPMLFTVEVSFAIIRKIQLKIGKDIKGYILLVILIIVNIFSVYLAKQNILQYYWLPILKIMFFMVFFQLGKIYKNDLEKIENNIPTIMVFIITITINLIMIKIYHNINFISLYSMKGFSHLAPFVPIICSITGIWFWLRISKILVGVIGNNKLVNKISNSTKDIMMHHIFCIYLINLIFLLLNQKLKFFNDFNSQKFINSYGWYMYYLGMKQFGIVYIFIGIFGSMKIKELQTFIVEKFKNIYWLRLKK